MIDTHHIARRGLQVAHTLITRSADDDNKPGHAEHPMIAVPVFVLTILAFAAVMFTVSYTCGHVITTLTMVESSSTNAYVPISNVDSGSNPTDNDSPPAYFEDTDGPKPPTNSARTDVEVNLVRTRPTTSSIRDTVDLLRSRDGMKSLFRGFWVYMAWNVSRAFLVALLSVLISTNAFGLMIAAIIAEILLAQLHMTWIHVVISEPSNLRWYQRIPSTRGTWKKVAPAVAIWAVTSQIVTVLPMLICGSFGTINRMKDPNYHPDPRAAYATVGQLFMAMLLTLTLFILLQIPATVTMVRVVASMLPDEDETIVPFDRTFDGLTTPAIIGGQGKIGIVEAWRSFNWECRQRLLRTVGKVAVIAVVVWLAFTAIISAEIFLLGGETIGEMMKGMHRIPSRGH